MNLPAKACWRQRAHDVGELRGRVTEKLKAEGVDIKRAEFVLARLLDPGRVVPA